MGNRGFVGGIFAGNCAILWFIILFLLIFWQPYGVGYGAGVAAVKE